MLQNFQKVKLGTFQIHRRETLFEKAVESCFIHLSNKYLNGSFFTVSYDLILNYLFATRNVSVLNTNNSMLVAKKRVMEDMI